MQQALPTLLGKGVRLVARLRGSGSALPGLIVERISPGYVARALASLPYGVLVVSGTNGKTTTTKIITEILEGQGLRVFTNRTGSNFTRGIAAALLGEVSASGKLNADIAVLELDEAYAVHFVNQIQPRYSLLLNVMRDQLDRFGELETTADLLRQIIARTTGSVIINADDPYIANPKRLPDTKAKIVGYNVAPDLQALFPSDDALYAGPDKPFKSMKSLATLTALDGQMASFQVAGHLVQATLQLKGLYNMQNATGAILTAWQILGDKLDLDQLTKSLESVTPAFGRGETITAGKSSVELILVKNPSGFNLALSGNKSNDNRPTMIAINDQYADGRDVSWLWDVDFTKLGVPGVDTIAGSRAYDMALRLQYDGITAKHVSPDLVSAVAEFLRHNQSGELRIFCTYTAMLRIRKLLVGRGRGRL